MPSLPQTRSLVVFDEFGGYYRARQITHVAAVPAAQPYNSEPRWRVGNPT